MRREKEEEASANGRIRQEVARGARKDKELVRTHDLQAGTWMEVGNMRDIDRVLPIRGGGTTGVQLVWRKWTGAWPRIHA
jgi:hypothetical protein